MINPNSNINKNVDDNDTFQRLSSKSGINLQFTDITYSTKAFGQNWKTILNSVSGEFRAGELSAIIGPSGCGKTTLLNLLAAYRIKKTSGNIYVNGKLQNAKEFRKILRYVLQEDHIYPFFTVLETMMNASNFKLDPHISRQQRETVVYEFLDKFRLREQANTMMSNVSGGERKRVCVALELLNKPSVILLDEPTTGLDELSAFQCIKLLKEYALAGCTIICSIHAPSHRLFKLFDHTYALAGGECIYQGAIHHIVNYMLRLGLRCPLTYNPVDFLIETSTCAYGDYHADMVQEMINGKVIKWQPDLETTHTLYQRMDPQVFEAEMQLDAESDLLKCNKISWWREYKYLFLRIMKQIWCDKLNLKLRIFVPLFLAALIGHAYANVGRNAMIGIYNYHLVLVTVVFCVFTSMSPIIPYAALEMKYLKREHLNQWYRLSTYFVALQTTQFVNIFIMSFLSSALLYFLSYQPTQLFRFLLFFGITLLTSMVSSSFGLLVASRLNLVNGLFLSPAVMGVWLLLGNYPTEKTHLKTWESIAMYSSCLRQSVEGLLASLFDFDRNDLVCPTTEIFCPLSKPALILRIVGSLDLHYLRSALVLLGFYILFTGLAYLNFKSRLLGERLTHQKFMNLFENVFSYKKR